MSRLASAATILGLCVLVAGIALIYVPAAVIAAGLILAAAGLTDFKG